MSLWTCVDNPARQDRPATMADMKRVALVDSWMQRATIHQPTRTWRQRADCYGCRGPITADLCTTCPVRIDCLADAWRTEHEDIATALHLRGGIGWADRVRWYRTQPHPIEHDTERGYHQHRTRGETPCDTCKAAHNRHARTVAKRTRAR